MSRAEIIEKGKVKRIGVSVIVAEVNGGIEIKMISVFRIEDKKGMIKSIATACTQ